MKSEQQFLAYLIKELCAFRAKSINVRVQNFVNTDVYVNVPGHHAISGNQSNLISIDQWRGREHADLAYMTTKYLYEQLTLKSNGTRPGAFSMNAPVVGLYLDPSLFKTPLDIMVGFVPEGASGFILVLSVRSLQKELKYAKEHIDAFYSNFKESELLSTLMERL